MGEADVAPGSPPVRACGGKTNHPAVPLWSHYVPPGDRGRAEPGVLQQSGLRGLLHLRQRGRRAKGYLFFLGRPQAEGQLKNPLRAYDHWLQGLAGRIATKELRDTFPDSRVRDWREHHLRSGLTGRARRLDGSLAANEARVRPRAQADPGLLVWRVPSRLFDVTTSAHSDLESSGELFWLGAYVGGGEQQGSEDLQAGWATVLPGAPRM